MLHHRATRSRVTALIVVVLFLVTACDGNSTVPAAPPTDTPTASSSSGGSASSEGYEISDVRLVTVRDPVIFWQVTFDARWLGAGSPEESRCRWRMLGADGVAIVSGGLTVDERKVNDEVAASVYPDEIPGVPKQAKVECTPA